MNSPESDSAKAHLPVPEVFHSSDTGKPIAHCLMCNKFLLDEGTDYFIEKAIKQHPEFKIKEVIFEYALCMACSVKMNDAMSTESRLRLATYFSQHAEAMQRRQASLNETGLPVESRIEKCMIKNTAIAECSEYQLVAQCSGKHLVCDYMPFALSLEAMDEMTMLLSEKTLGEMDDFIGRYFSGPPEVAALLRKRLIFI